MDYVTIPGYDVGVNPDDKPRFLTKEEIMYIVSHMPLAPSSDSDAAQFNREHIMRWLADQMREVKMCPSAIPEFIEKMTEHHYNSLIDPGTAVGIRAAEAIGATSTQMTLNSVAPFERILIQDHEGKPHLYRIGDWIDSLLNNAPDKIKHIPENRTQYLELSNPVTIATPHADGKVSWEKVTAVTKHLPVGDLVKITTRSGREVTATQSKSLLVWNGSSLQQVNGSSVKIGDKVPIFCNNIDPPNVINEINLRDFLNPKQWLYGSELRKLYESHKSYNVPGKKNFWSTMSRLDNLPYNRGDSAMVAVNNGLLKGNICSGYVYPKSWGGSIKTKIPETIKFDREFGVIVGLYLAEGLCTDTYIGISNNDETIQKIVYNWCDSLGVGYHTTVTKTSRGTSTDTNIHSVLLARFFRSWLNTGAANKIMPPEVLLANKEFIKGVLDGYFAGDGTVNQRDGYLVISSASKDLITGFGALCNRLGIFGKQSSHQPSSNNIGSQNILRVNTYTIRNWNAIVWADMIGSCHPDKCLKMAQMKETQKNNTTVWGIYYDRINDIMLDPIVSVEYVKPSEYVYDLTVPVTTNFSLWNGLGIADTFHSSGSAKSVSAGNDALTDIIFARKNPKNESCTIYYTNKQMTYEEVLNTRSYIVGSMVSDFIVDYDIDDIANLPRFWWHNTISQLLGKKIDPRASKVLRLFLNLPEMYKHRVTVAQIAKVLELEVPSGIVAIHGPSTDAIIDVYCQPDLILKTLQDNKIVNVPAEYLEITFLQTIVMPGLENIRVKGIPGIKRLFPIVSPIWRVVTVERKVDDRDLTDPNLAQVFKQYEDSGYILLLNQGMMNMTGITSRNVAALCQLAGLNVLGSPALRPGENNHDRLYVAMPNDRFRTSDGSVVISVNGVKYKYVPSNNIVRRDNNIYRIVRREDIKQDQDGWIESLEDNVKERVPDDQIIQINDDAMRKVLDYVEQNGNVYERISNPNIKISELKPGDYINYRISADKNQRMKTINDLTRQMNAQAQQLPDAQRRALLRTPINVPKTPLMLASEFVFAETEGANLKELLALPGIDKRRTTCNNMYIIAETFGIEAARSFIIRALTNVVSNSGSYVHPANITFIAEFITSRGKPYGATYTGISRQPGGHLSLATLERAAKVFTQNAIHGRKEDIRGVSASVVVGARMSIGTGYSDVGQEISENGQKKIVINDDLFTAHERDENQKQIMQQMVVPEGDLTDAVTLLKAMTSGGGNFDNFGGEEETNLLTLFSAGEVIPEINQRRERDDKIVLSKQPTQAYQVPNELVDVLTTIKTGIPDNDQTNIGVIKALSAEEFEPEISAKPIVSTGLVTLDDMLPATIETFGGIFDELLTLPTAAQAIASEQLPLPEIAIPELPPLDDFDVQRDLYETRREQVRELKPIDIDAFRNIAGNVDQ